MGSIVSSKKKKTQQPQPAAISEPEKRPSASRPSNNKQINKEESPPVKQPSKQPVPPPPIKKNQPKKSVVNTDDIEPPVSVEDISLDEWLSQNLIYEEAVKEKAKQREVGTWIEIRLFISSTFIDTHSERDILVQRVIPSINRKLASKFIRVIPVDLRWGVLANESNSCEAIQKTCLNQVDKCREDVLYMPWFLGLRTDRYGWVQDKYLPDNGFEQPQLYEWFKRFESYGKNVSITSLEVMQASQSGKIKNESPTVFFYKRNMLDLPDKPKGTKFPEEFRWIFEFEYVEKEMEDLQLKFQYNVNENASAYEQDRDALNKFIQDHPEIKWSEYNAQYQNAKITLKRENAKSFGVGYVKKLEEFEKQVDEDLMDSILSNYSSVDTTQVDNYAMESIQHSNAVKFKAATFVGRKDLVEKAFQHCITSTTSDANTLVLHGEPGCGKSGLLAKVTVDCMSRVEETKDFLFIHAVDTCPGSSSLEGMMRRLQINLRKYRRDMGETKLAKRFKGNASKLKQQHHKFMIESAKKYPDKLFLIIVDAVNQFNTGLGAWDMWWLPPKEAPKNLKFMISTLNQENGTFQNACHVSPDAQRLPIENMSHEDLQEMVRATLERFNKKLTENEDPILGNQMEKLLSKSQSPLYLIAACEALRKFGIFEKVTQYIESLPNTITDLFSFLLDEWSEKYGKLFVEDVAGLLCASKDGLLENQINDLLHFKEQREKGDGEFLYDANFPRIYDSIAHFLAAGGGGYLRFFHVQLKYTVRRKFMTELFEQETHVWMRDFFEDIVSKQCRETPQEEPPAYFEHALEQLVYHQLKAHQNQDLPLESLKMSLRNIYFVKERIVAKQHQSLSDEYALALETLTNTDDIDALKQWASFVQLYTSYIREFPNFCLNMAVSQAPVSNVTKDTLALGTEPSVKGEAYPLYWANIPEECDPMLVKYDHGGRDIAASDTQGDIVAIAAGSKVKILDQSSGELIHILNVPGMAVWVSVDGKSLLVGDMKGKLSWWDVSTATMEDSIEIFDEDTAIVWLECTENKILIGSGSSDFALSLWEDNKHRSWIAVLDKKSLETVKKWCTEKTGFDYCYNERLEMIFSAHLGGEIIGWDLQGNQLCSATAGDGVVYCVSCHPTENKIISGSNMIREWKVDKSSMEVCNEIKDTGVSKNFTDVSSVCYDHNGKRICSTEYEILRIYSLAGERLEELRGHKLYINKIVLVPGGNQAVTTGFDDPKVPKGQSILWELPETKEMKKDSPSKIVDEKVLWCGFTFDGNHFLTISNDFLKLYETATLELKISKERSYYSDSDSQCLIHPDGKHIFSFTSEKHITCYSVNDLELVSQFEIDSGEDNDGNGADDGANGDTNNSEGGCNNEDGGKINEDVANNGGNGDENNRNGGDGGEETEDVDDEEEDERSSVDLKCMTLDITGKKLMVVAGKLFTGNIIKLFDVSDLKDFKLEREIPVELEEVQGCHLNKDADLGCISEPDRGIQVFDLSSGELKYQINRGKSICKFFSSNNCLLYADGNNLYKYDPESEKDVCEYKGHSNFPVDVVFLNDETQIMTVSRDGTLRIFDIETGENVYAYFNHRANEYTSLTAHPSGKTFLAANENYLLFLLKTVNNVAIN
eukprot:TCONS_00020849-protein